MTGERRLELGDPLPPIARGKEPIEVGWHPVCGHVRHIAVGHRLEGLFSPGLTYGVLPNDEARRRIGECADCRPPAQSKLWGGGLEDE